MMHALENKIAAGDNNHGFGTTLLSAELAAKPFKVAGES